MPNLVPLYRKYLPLLDLEIVPLPSPEMLEAMAGQSVDKDLPVLTSAVPAVRITSSRVIKRTLPRQKRAADPVFKS